MLFGNASYEQIEQNFQYSFFITFNEIVPFMANYTVVSMIMMENLKGTFICMYVSHLIILGLISYLQSNPILMLYFISSFFQMTHTVALLKHV